MIWLSLNLLRFIRSPSACYAAPETSTFQWSSFWGGLQMQVLAGTSSQLRVKQDRKIASGPIRSLPLVRQTHGLAVAIVLNLCYTEGRTYSRQMTKLPCPANPDSRLALGISQDEQRLR